MLSLQGDARQPQPLHKLQSLPQLQQLFGVSVPGGSGFHALGASDAETPFALQLLDSSADIKTLITKPIEGDEDIHLNLSHENYKAGNYNKALEYSNDVYIKNPKRTDNLLLLGAIYYQLQDFDACIAKNQEALAIDPHFPECYGNMANAWKLRPNFADAWSNLASAYTRIGRLNDAAQCCRHALALNPRLVDAHSNLGNLMKAQGLYQEAYNCYLEALRVQPTFAIAWSNLAGLLMEVGDLDRALLYYKCVVSSILCQEAVKLKPKFADAYLNLGNVYKSLRMPQDAILCYQHAIQERPTYAMAYESLLCQLCIGDILDAGNLAGIYYEQGQLDLAILHYKQAINCDSTFVEAYNNLGNALKDTGHVEEAINCYRSCLAFQPSHPQALTNLGNIYMECNCMGIAASFYKATLSVTTGLSAPFSNLAMIYKQQGNYAETIACYNEVLRIDPSAADGLVNRGNTFKEIGRVSEAIQDYIRAVNIRPTMPEAHANLASAYKDSGLAEAAIKSYRQALMLRPDFPEATCNLLHTLQCVCDWDDREKRFSEVESILRRQIKMSVLPSVQPFHAIAYPIDKMLALEISRRYAAHCSIIASRYGLPAFAHPLRVPVKADSKSGRLRVGYVPSVVLCLGYMSSDFGNHPLSHLMGSVFGMHNQENIEVFCYALSQNDGSEWRQRIQSEAEHFIDVSSMSSDLIARKINEDGINILVNLNGYTKGARNEIFAMQPAPIQVSYMGFPGTTGASYIDYLVTDEFVSPTRLSHIYSEKLVHLPHCYFVNDYKQKNRDVLVPISRHKRADYGLPEDKFVFACFNQLYKMDPDIFNTWCNILNRVPSSALWLLRFPAAGETRLRAWEGMELHPLPCHPLLVMPSWVSLHQDIVPQSRAFFLHLLTKCCRLHSFPSSGLVSSGKPPSEITHEADWARGQAGYGSGLVIGSTAQSGRLRFTPDAAAQGVKPDQIIFTDVAAKNEHIRRSALADLFLDTPLCNGHTTGTDVLWAGLPMVTLPLDKMATRVAGSLCLATGVGEEMIVYSLKEYEERAVGLAENPVRLQALSSRLKAARMTCPLFDTKRWVKLNPIKLLITCLGRGNAALGRKLHGQIGVDAEVRQQVGVPEAAEARQVGLLQRRAACLARVGLRLHRADARLARGQPLLGHLAQSLPRRHIHIDAHSQRHHHHHHNRSGHSGNWLLLLILTIASSLGAGFKGLMHLYSEETGEPVTVPLSGVAVTGGLKHKLVEFVYACAWIGG
ncbi:hypothetical protein ZIOFF_011488 [Zingiber officinale]|uniref:protein O-GlcNAc transferase n=1 Tax=Zingiber officinale TaxID=94328 RepID=A0A8J5LKT6_ZINOF|nr:hypothetical protein ZIOFF_011488 [Zingiber officinale]